MLKYKIGVSYASKSQPKVKVCDVWKFPEKREFSVVVRDEIIGYLQLEYFRLQNYLLKSTSGKDRINIEIVNNI